ncbi:MAG: hypothetical protein ACR2PZ_13930 [Pseudomonadales bacterium]
MGHRTLPKHSQITLLIAALASATAFAAPGRADPRLVVILEAQPAVGMPGSVPDIDGDGLDDDGFCFDGALVDAKTNKVIGTAQECLSATPTGMTYATTTLNFPSGSIVARGKISVLPVQWDPATNPDVDPAVGAVTGYFPAPGTNNILSGTGRFANATGRVRLSGAARDFGDGTANLNCLFIIDLD